MEKTLAQLRNEWMLSVKLDPEKLYDTMEKLMLIHERKAFMKAFCDFMNATNADDVTHYGLDMRHIVERALERGARDYSRIETSRLAYEKFHKANNVSTHRQHTQVFNSAEMAI